MSKVGDHASVWERVLRKVRSGQMPPIGLPHPDAAASASFTKSLENSLDQAAAANPNPGRPAVHRLNRAEYSNAIRDLLAVDIKPGSQLPVDDSGYGFDNIGDVLSISPVLLERYITMARMISRLAVGDPTIKPSEDEYTVNREAGGRVRNERVSDDLPFDSRGGLAFRRYFPLDAEYTFRVKLNGNAERRPLEVRLPVKAGLRTVGVAFLRESTKAEVEAPASRRGGAVVNAVMSKERRYPRSWTCGWTGKRCSGLKFPRMPFRLK